MKRPFIVLTVALLILAGCYTNPVTGRQSLVLVPEGEELQLGAQTFAEIKKEEKISTNGAANERVRRIGERIAAAVGNELPSAQWEFVVFESDQINAFALPGGKVGVYTGLLALAKSDDELAIVMGHEIGHVTARHGSERMSTQMVAQGIGTLGTAYANGKFDDKTIAIAQQVYGGVATVGAILPQSRGNESEADKMGMIYAARAGYDPRAAITFWQKMKAASEKAGGKPMAWFSTHPADDKRIADLEAYMPQVLPIYEAARTK